MNDTLTLPATLTGFSTKADGSLSIRFATQELTAEDKIALFPFLNAFGWLAFRNNPISTADLPTEQAEDRQKTPSKRLRAVLYVLAQQRGIKDFEPWYRQQVEKIIERIKLELDK